jgi:hypothetical protein
MSDLLSKVDLREYKDVLSRLWIVNREEFGKDGIAGVYGKGNIVRTFLIDPPKREKYAVTP